MTHTQDSLKCPQKTPSKKTGTDLDMRVMIKENKQKQASKMDALKLQNPLCTVL